MKPVFTSILALLLCYMGFYNGFPIVDSDTGAYMRSGFTNEVPIDRPIVYGIFLRHISLKESLWLVIFIQSFLLSYSVYCFFKYFSKAQQFTLQFLGFFAMVLVFTGVSVIASTLMPDVFTPMLLLTFMVLFFADGVTRKHKIICGFLFLLSLGVHNSHFALIGFFLLISTVVVLVARFRKRKGFMTLPRLGTAWGLLVAGWLSVCTLHVSLGSTFSLSQGTHVFTLSRLIDMGILKDYLDENCAEKDYKLCEYKDQLPWDFIWDYDHSPLYKTGGWIDNKKEYNTIIADVLTRPKYLKRYLLRSVESGFEQFFCFDVGPHNPLNEGSSPFASMIWFYKNQLKEYQGTKQAVGKLTYDGINFTQRIFILLTMIILALLLYSGELDPRTRTMLWVLVFLVFCNAFVCGMLSGVVPRYQARVVWLLALPVFICLTEKGLLRKVCNRYLNRA